MFIHPTKFDDAVLFSRLDESNVLSTVSAHEIFLEEQRWKTAEHYFQINSVARLPIQDKMRQLDEGLAVYKLGSPWYRRKRSDFKQVRMTLMTRALYTKVQMYKEVREALLETEQRMIAETSAYDHYWGVGRDQRGENKLGEIWMNIRSRLAKEMSVAEQKKNK